MSASSTAQPLSSTSLKPTTRATLIKLVEEHISTLIREANCVKRHAKRARINMTSGAVGAAGRGNVNGPQGGYVKRRLHAEDINMALQWRGSEKLYATTRTGMSLTERGQREASRKVDLEEYLKSEMELAPPNEVGLTVHWLAVDGSQPNIPQNPPARERRALTATDATAKGLAKSGAQVVNRIEDEKQPDKSESDVKVNRLLPRLLSEELQLYFTRVTNSIERGGTTVIARQQQDATLSSISQDAGLQELVPFLVNYVSQSLYKNIGNSDQCRLLVRMAFSLLSNVNLHLELHLHQLLPALLTCIVAKRLSFRSSENHWALRREAAATLVRACNLFGDQYVTLKARVMKTLWDAAEGDKALSTQYGGLVGITVFGANTIDAFILSSKIAMNYWNQWEEELDHTQSPDRRVGLQMCQHALLNALGVFFTQKDHMMLGDRFSWEELEDTFGDRLVAIGQESTEYSLCVV